MSDVKTTANDLSGWIGHKLVDGDGHKIGNINDIYVDDATGQPEWLAVSTGLFGSKVSFVPLEGCTADGDNLVSPYSKDQVKDAPNAEADGGLEPDEEDALYSHYGRTKAPAPEPEGHDTSGPTTDTAMTRSEEEMNARVENVETGKARLKKYVVTEHESVTVPVRHEEVRVEREPITDANRDSAAAGPDISEEEHEVTIHEERPVVETETVAKERVRLDTETVTEQETVEGDIRKEKIEVEGDVKDGDMKDGDRKG